MICALAQWPSIFELAVSHDFKSASWKFQVYMFFSFTSYQRTDTTVLFLNSAQSFFSRNNTNFELMEMSSKLQIHFRSNKAI